nr:MAG TPA: hypothetical protein [Caudoviricetes sp.]
MPPFILKQKGYIKMEIVEKVKNSLVEYMLNIDKSSLSMSELREYSETVDIIDKMFRPDWKELWVQNACCCGGGINGIDKNDIETKLAVGEMGNEVAK